MTKIGNLSMKNSYPLLLILVPLSLFGEDLYYSKIRKIMNETVPIEKRALLDTVSPKNTPYIRHSYTDDICNEEKKAVLQRQKKVIQALKNLVPECSLEEPERAPTIALCLSGGGFRAMVASLGFLEGLNDIGLLDCITYISCLSGSTWAIAPWIASEQPLDMYIKSIPYKLNQDMNASLVLSTCNKIIEKILYLQSFSLIECYAEVLANILLPEWKRKKFEVTISDTHSHIANGTYPIPIYSAIAANRRPYEWFEITPYEVGNASSQSYVPLNVFTKTSGPSDIIQEPSLAHFLAVFGSAFTADIVDYLRLKGKPEFYFEINLPTQCVQALKKCVTYLVYEILSGIRLFPAQFFNYMYQHAQSHLFQHDRSITLIDAGIDFNIPLPPLLRPSRLVDIVIIYDASSENGYGISELQHAYHYANWKQIPLPHCSFETIRKEHITVIPSTEQSVPTILYIPLIANKEYCPVFDPQECSKNGYAQTHNFAYSYTEVMQLKGLPHHTVIQTRDKIMQPIIEYMQ
jgi:hypothetical protein